MTVQVLDPTHLEGDLTGAGMPRGFPRPRLEVLGYENGPAPYVAGSVSQPGTLDFSRSAETKRGFLCAVCGLEVTDDRCGVATGLRADGADPNELTIDEDHGLSHEKCARLTVAWCPAFTGMPGLAQMMMWMVDTDSLRRVWPRLGTDLTIGQLTGKEQLLPPAGARRPWAAHG